MHSSVAAAIRAAQATSRKAIAERYPGRITINGESYDVGVTYGEFEEQLRDGGIVTVRGCSIIIQRALMPTRPIGGTEVTVQGENGGTFFVKTTQGDLNSDSWVLRCSANRE